MVAEPEWRRFDGYVSWFQLETPVLAFELLKMASKVILNTLYC